MNHVPKSRTWLLRTDAQARSPALPLEFDSYLYRLEQVERASKLVRIREHGALAVADALSDLIP